jgi:hypothetical protein
MKSIVSAGKMPAVPGGIDLSQWDARTQIVGAGGTPALSGGVDPDPSSYL